MDNEPKQGRILTPEERRQLAEQRAAEREAGVADPADVTPLRESPGYDPGKGIEGELGHEYTIGDTDWSPERKIVGGAVAVLVVGLAQQVAGFDLFPGAEGAIAIVVAYSLPNKR